MREAYSLVWSVLVLLFRSRVSLEAEILILRHQLNIQRRHVFADILKVGVSGLINIAITNLSVVLLTRIAGQLGRDTALGYPMGARLE